MSRFILFGSMGLLLLFGWALWKSPPGNPLRAQQEVQQQQFQRADVRQNLHKILKQELRVSQPGERAFVFKIVRLVEKDKLSLDLVIG
ncbi:MAG: hypothetical protein N2C14_33125, partial [Planctomycetales bacterium]